MKPHERDLFFRMGWFGPPAEPVWLPLIRWQVPLDFRVRVFPVIHWRAQA